MRRFGFRRRRLRSAPPWTAYQPCSPPSGADRSLRLRKCHGPARTFLLPLNDEHPRIFRAGQKGKRSPREIRHSMYDSIYVGRLSAVASVAQSRGVSLELSKAKRHLSPTPTTSSVFRGTQGGDGVLSVGRTFPAYCALCPVTHRRTI